MVSVLLPVRNGSATLDTALESLYGQSHAPERCVVVDDGSTDSTPELLERWRLRWPAMRVVRTEGLGISRALNLGLFFCDTTWVARMDADDRAHPRRLELQLATAATAGPLAALVGCSVRHWTPEPSPDARYDGMRRHIDWANAHRSHEELERALWVDSPLPHPSWLVRREVFETVGGYDESGELPEDYDWLHRFFAASRVRPDLRAFKAEAEPLLDWAESDARLTRTSPAYSERAFGLVKARALARMMTARPTPPSRIFLFGLGPKAKALLPLVTEALGSAVPIMTITAIVEVNPRQIGTRYRDLPVVDVEGWRREASDSFVLIALGTPDARDRAERLCLETGLAPLRDFVAL